jgi:hypothetical protein
MAISSSHSTGITLESIKSTLPEGVEVYVDRGTGRMVFLVVDNECNYSHVALIYKKPDNCNSSLRLDCKRDDGKFPRHEAGIVTDPDGWKFRTVKLAHDDAEAQMKELLEAIKELAAA